MTTLTNGLISALSCHLPGSPGGERRFGSGLVNHNVRAGSNQIPGVSTQIWSGWRRSEKYPASSPRDKVQAAASKHQGVEQTLWKWTLTYNHVR
jgi:hypothetical protein